MNFSQERYRPASEMEIASYTLFIELCKTVFLYDLRTRMQNLSFFFFHLNSLPSSRRESLVFVEHSSYIHSMFEFFRIGFP